MNNSRFLNQTGNSSFWAADEDTQKKDVYARVQVRCKMRYYNQILNSSVGSQIANAPNMEVLNRNHENTPQKLGQKALPHKANSIYRSAGIEDDEIELNSKGDLKQISVVYSPQTAYSKNNKGFNEQIAVNSIAHKTRTNASIYSSYSTGISKSIADSRNQSIAIQSQALLGSYQDQQQSFNESFSINNQALKSQKKDRSVIYTQKCHSSNSNRNDDEIDRSLIQTIKNSNQYSVNKQSHKNARLNYSNVTLFNNNNCITETNQDIEARDTFYPPNSLISQSEKQSFYTNKLPNLTNHDTKQQNQKLQRLPSGVDQSLNNNETSLLTNEDEILLRLLNQKESNKQFGLNNLQTISKYHTNERINKLEESYSRDGGNQIQDQQYSSSFNSQSITPNSKQPQQIKVMENQNKKFHHRSVHQERNEIYLDLSRHNLSVDRNNDSTNLGSKGEIQGDINNQILHYMKSEEQCNFPTIKEERQITSEKQQLTLDVIKKKLARISSTIERQNRSITADGKNLTLLQSLNTNSNQLQNISSDEIQEQKQLGPDQSDQDLSIISNSKAENAEDTESLGYMDRKRKKLTKFVQDIGIKDTLQVNDLGKGSQVLIKQLVKVYEELLFFIEKRDIITSIFITASILDSVVQADDIDLFIKLVLFVAELCYHFEDFNKAIFFYDQARMISEYTHCYLHKCMSLLGLGLCALKLKEPHSGISLVQKALQYAWKLNNKNEEIQIYQILGRVDLSQFYHERFIKGDTQCLDSPNRSMSENDLNIYLSTRLVFIKNINRHFLAQISLPILDGDSRQQNNLAQYVQLLKNNNTNSRQMLSDNQSKRSQGEQSSSKQNDRLRKKIDQNLMEVMNSQFEKTNWLRPPEGLCDSWKPNQFENANGKYLIDYLLKTKQFEFQLETPIYSELSKVQSSDLYKELKQEFKSDGQIKILKDDQMIRQIKEKEKFERELLRHQNANGHYDPGKYKVGLYEEIDQRVEKFKDYDLEAVLENMQQNTVNQTQNQSNTWRVFLNHQSYNQLYDTRQKVSDPFFLRNKYDLHLKSLLKEFVLSQQALKTKTAQIKDNQE